jgi:hypothetical protein
MVSIILLRSLSIIVTTLSTSSEGADVYLNNAVARMAQCLITLMIMPIVGFSGLVLLVADAKATAALCFLIGLSALFVVITIECAATRILKAIQAHPRAFAAELKSDQRHLEFPASDN